MPLLARPRARLDIVVTSRLSASDAAAFDAFVEASPSGSYAQARAWGPAALAGRRFVARWFLARRRGSMIGAAFALRPRAVGPTALPLTILERGPVAAAADLPDVLRALRRAFPGRLQVMPYFAGDEAAQIETLLAAEGFRVVHDFGSAHARTLRVDLTSKELFAGKSGESLRRKIRQAEKAGVTARRGEARDLPVLERLYAELMRGQEKRDKPAVYFEALASIVEDGRHGAIFLAEHEGAAVSALYASRHGSIATFVVGASSPAEKSFSKMVPSMVAAIRWAKDEGCATFDMGGIPMEGDADEKRRSIAQFKLDFAKAPVTLVREHARWL